VETATRPWERTSGRGDSVEEALSSCIVAWIWLHSKGKEGHKRKKEGINIHMLSCRH
jgi:hypothetical protein